MVWVLAASRHLEHPVPVSDPETPIPSSSTASSAAQTGQGSVASLVLGILALLTSWILVGFVFAVLAIVFGRRVDPLSGVSRAGVALGWVAIAVGVLAAVARGVAAVNA